MFIGNQVSRTKGDGIEFADVREWEPGDRVRRVNWRASARRGGLWVNDQHPERNTDVVLFLDTFADVHSGRRGTLDLTVRAATSLAHRYLQRKDRVGLVSFSGFLTWLLPASGTHQLYTIVDSLLQMDVVLSFATKGVDVLPPRTLPPKALVLALTPLLDPRSAAALLDLRARGYDLVVIEVSPVPFIEPGEASWRAVVPAVAAVARVAARATSTRACRSSSGSTASRSTSRWRRWRHSGGTPGPRAHNARVVVGARLRGRAHAGGRARNIRSA